MRVYTCTRAGARAANKPATTEIAAAWRRNNYVLMATRFHSLPPAARDEVYACKYISARARINLLRAALNAGIKY